MLVAAGCFAWRLRCHRIAGARGARREPQRAAIISGHSALLRNGAMVQCTPSVRCTAQSRSGTRSPIRCWGPFSVPALRARTVTTALSLTGEGAPLGSQVKRADRPWRPPHSPPQERRRCRDLGPPRGARRGHGLRAGRRWKAPLGPARERQLHLGLRLPCMGPHRTARRGHDPRAGSRWVLRMAPPLNLAQRG